MINRTVDNYLAHENYVGSVACCDCGYHRNGAHHPKIKCPKTGRCGDCGNDWPCREHAPTTTFMAYGNFTEPTKQVNFIVITMFDKRSRWSRLRSVINSMLKPWVDGKEKLHWNVDGESRKGELRDTQLALRFFWDGETLELLQ